jgi:hypothetical protein
MTVKQKVLNLISELEASIAIEDNPSLTAFHVTIDSPDKMVWNANLGHCVISWVYNPYSKTPVWKSLLEDIKEGITECEESECDYCHPI